MSKCDDEAEPRTKIELLAASRHGRIEALTIAHVASRIAQILELVRAGRSEQYQSYGRSM